MAYINIYKLESKNYFKIDKKLAWIQYCNTLVYNLQSLI